MRMVTRFSQKFGGDEHSLRVIDECLSSKLKNRDRIEAKDFDEIQDELRRKLMLPNRG